MRPNKLDKSIGDINENYLDHIENAYSKEIEALTRVLARSCATETETQTSVLAKTPELDTRHSYEAQDVNTFAQSLPLFANQINNLTMGLGNPLATLSVIQPEPCASEIQSLVEPVAPELEPQQTATSLLFDDMLDFDDLNFNFDIDTDYGAQMDFPTMVPTVTPTISNSSIVITKINRNTVDESLACVDNFNTVLFEAAQTLDNTNLFDAIPSANSSTRIDYRYDVTTIDPIPTDTVAVQNDEVDLLPWERTQRVSKTSSTCDQAP